MKKVTVYTLVLALILVTGAVVVEAEEIQLISPYTTLEKGESYIFSIALSEDTEDWLGWVQEEFEGYKNFQYLDAQKNGLQIYVLARAETPPSTAGYHGRKIASDFDFELLADGSTTVKSLSNGVYETNLEYIPNSLLTYVPIKATQASSDVIPKSGEKYALGFSSHTLHQPGNSSGSIRYDAKRLIADVLRDTSFLHLTTGINESDGDYALYVAFTLRPGFSTDQTLYQLGKSWATTIEDKMDAPTIWEEENVTFAKAYELVPHQID